MLQAHPYSSQLSTLSDEEVALRVRLLGFGKEDVEALHDLRERVQLKQIVIDTFTKDLAQHPQVAAMFQKLGQEGRLEAVVGKVAAAFEQFLDGVIDRAYVEHRLHIGRVHAHIGLEQKWYLSALQMVQQRAVRVYAADPEVAKEPARALRAAQALQKIMTFDIITVLDAYNASGLEVARVQELALRELSLTPVIEVWNEVLVLPIVGTVDSRRSQAITESLLTAVVEKQARVVIVDITGLPAMDTATANHLLKTVRAVELLGAAALVTGIRPAIAQTVVALGVDTSTIKTKARLADGLKLAFELLGSRAEARRLGDLMSDGAGNSATASSRHSTEG